MAKDEPTHTHVISRIAGRVDHLHKQTNKNFTCFPGKNSRSGSSFCGSGSHTLHKTDNLNLESMFPFCKTTTVAWNSSSEWKDLHSVLPCASINVRQLNTVDLQITLMEINGLCVNESNVLSIIALGGQRSCPESTTRFHRSRQHLTVHIWNWADDLTLFLTLCPTLEMDHVGAITVANGERTIQEWNSLAQNEVSPVWGSLLDSVSTACHSKTRTEFTAHFWMRESVLPSIQ